MSASAAIALNDLADQVVAAADLDDDARRDVDFDIEVGDPDIAIYQSLLATRTPLPQNLLQQIQEGISNGWWTQTMRDRALSIIERQLRAA